MICDGLMALISKNSSSGFFVKSGSSLSLKYSCRNLTGTCFNISFNKYCTQKFEILIAK